MQRAEAYGTIADASSEGKMIRIRLAIVALAPVLLVGAKAGAQSNNCTEFIKTSEVNQKAVAVLKVQNVSKQPVVAYVVVNAPKTTSDPKSYSFHGVFTAGDSLRPNQAIQLGTIPRRQVYGLMQVDYVRLADGTTCGATTTEDAKQIAARFQ
jgi:hypothetical protein